MEVAKIDRNIFFERYAEVVAAIGLNVQPDKELYVRAPIEAASFVPHIVGAAYRRGAKYVHVEYRDQTAIRARLESAPEETLSYVPPGTFAERLRVGREGGGSLSILGDDPTGLSGVDGRRRGVWHRALAEAGSDVRELAMSDHFPWCVVSIPNPVWARAAYPDRSPEEALDALFAAVAHACRLDLDDPVGAWERHSSRLMSIAGWLTEQAFDRLHYEAPGTDLSVGLPQGQYWIGTEGTSAEGVTFIANMPTDEVFCAPDRLRVEGTVCATRPTILEGTDVGVISLRIEAGRIVEASSERNQDVLLQELDLDEGARFFGEVALVTEDAPIAQLKTTFYDGLYDENAGCHFAFGNAYSNCVKGGSTMTADQRLEAGLNRSNVHADFTVGSDRLTITAYRADGSSFPIMERGRWSDRLEAAVGGV